MKEIFMKKELKSIKVYQSSKVTAILGFVLSALYALPLALYTMFYTQDKGAAVVFFLLPVVYLIFGFVLYAFIYFLYNQVAKIFGGIEMEFIDKE